VRSLIAWRVSLVGFALSAALFVGIAWTAFGRIRDLDVANAALEHTLHVRNDAEGILSVLKDAETGQRGFLVTGAQGYLDPYNTAAATLPGLVDAIRAFTADNPTQQANVNTLADLITRKLAELRLTITARQRDGFAAAASIVENGEGKRVMDAARTVVASILEEEERQLAARRHTQRQTTQSVITTSVGGLGGAFLLLAAATAFMARAVTDRERARLDQLTAEASAAVAQKSEELLRVTIASIGDAVITTDARGCVTRLNGVAESLTGWRQEEAAGRPLSEVFVIVNERTRDMVENPVDKVLRDGQIAGLANHTVLIARNGAEVPIDDSAAPIRSANHDILGVVLVFRDITGRRHSERELRMAGERFTQFLESVPCVLWEAWGQPDAATQRIDFVSGYVETMLGYTVEQWLGTPNFWLTIVHPDDREAAAQRAADAFHRGAPHVNRFRWLTTDGRPVEVETHADIIRDDAGTVIGMRGVTIPVA